MGDAAEAVVRGLTEEQRAAVTFAGSHLAIVAGAGTGKTRTLVHRVAWLIAGQNVPPENILAVTFTNKAARELRERLGSMLGPRGKEFHSVCLRLLRAYGKTLGLGANFGVVDRDDQQRILRRAMDECKVPAVTASGGKMLPALGRLISYLQFKGEREWTHASIRASAAGFSSERMLRDLDRDKRLSMAVAAYARLKARANVVDFDDLLSHARVLMQAQGPRNAFAGGVRHCLVDEFQDTNEAQLELVRQWVSVHERLTVVGDEDQSIYSFRHATPECLRALKTLYPKLATLKLTVNFRSTAPVLHAANMVIGQDERREEKKVLRPTEEHSGNSAGVIVASVNTFDDQAVLLAKQIRSLLACGDFDRSSVAIRGPPVAPSALQPSDVAVLYRTGAVSGSVERQLRVEGVPYRIVGGLSFFDRMEVRDTLAFLRMITNEADAASFERAAELFAGVGPATIRKHLDKSAAAKRTPVQQLQRASGRLRQLAETVRGLQQHLDKGGGLEDLLDLLIKQVNYEAIVRKRTQNDEDAFRDRWEHVSALRAMLRDADQRSAQDEGEDAGDDPTLTGSRGRLCQFLREAVLKGPEAGAGERDERPCVTLCTIHAAKGLEWPVVFLAGAQNGMIPHYFASTPEGRREERRLLYVAITRAQRGLMIVSPALGLFKPVPAGKCPYLLDMPASEHVQWVVGFGCEQPDDPDLSYDRSEGEENPPTSHSVQRASTAAYAGFQSASTALRGSSQAGAASGSDYVRSKRSEPSARARRRVGRGGRPSVKKDPGTVLDGLARKRRRRK